MLIHQSDRMQTIKMLSNLDFSFFHTLYVLRVATHCNSRPRRALMYYFRYFSFIIIRYISSLPNYSYARHEAIISMLMKLPIFDWSPVTLTSVFFFVIFFLGQLIFYISVLVHSLNRISLLHYLLILYHITNCFSFKNSSKFFFSRYFFS